MLKEPSIEEFKNYFTERNCSNRKADKLIQELDKIMKNYNMPFSTLDKYINIFNVFRCFYKVFYGYHFKL